MFIAPCSVVTAAWLWNPASLNTNISPKLLHCIVLQNLLLTAYVVFGLVGATICFGIIHLENAVLQ